METRRGRSMAAAEAMDAGSPRRLGERGGARIGVADDGRIGPRTRCERGGADQRRDPGRFDTGRREADPVKRGERREGAVAVVDAGGARGGKGGGGGSPRRRGGGGG